MREDTSPAVVTNTGRQLCDQVTEEVFAASDEPQFASSDAWPSIAETYGFRWNLASGNRIVGGLPETYNGQPVVDGPNQYVIKIALSTSSPPKELKPNYIEAIIWEQAVDKNLAHLFAPVIAHGAEYRWIIMEEVDVLVRDSWNEHGPVPYHDDKVEVQYREFKNALNKISEDYGGEAGIDRSGNVVAVDYEHFLGTEWAGMYDRRKMRHITFDDIRRRNRSDDKSSLEILLERILQIFG